MGFIFQFVNVVKTLLSNAGGAGLIPSRGTKILYATSRIQLCDPMNCSLPGSSVHGIVQTRILEWVAILFSRGSPAQGLNPGLSHCRQILYHLSYQECPVLTLAPSLCDPMDYIGQNTGVGSFSLLQGIFPTQGSNPGLSHCRWILYHLIHKGSPRVLEWVAYPFPQGIFPTQELSWGLLYCRWILYQLSYQGSPLKSQQGHIFFSPCFMQPRL